MGKKLNTLTQEQARKIWNGRPKLPEKKINKDSDAHGVGANRISIEEHHARLFVNSAMTMADFILSAELKVNSKK